jgi:hypothetical protein
MRWRDGVLLGTLYTAGVASRSGGGEESMAAGGALSRHRLLEGETTGQRRFMGNLKRSWSRIDSVPYGCRTGDQWRLAEQRHRPRAAAWPSAGGGRGPGWAQRPTGPISVGYKKKWKQAARGNVPKSKNKEE